jgi:hypothetical protein
MKKLVIICLGAIFVVIVGPQDLAAEGGIKIGVSFAKFNWTDAAPADLALGYLPFIAGGLYYDADLGPFFLQPELLVIRKGGRYGSRGDSLEFRFTYIEFPLLLRLDVLRAGTVRPFCAVGGYGSYLYGAEGVLSIGSERTVTDLIDDYKRYDFGLVVGAGLIFKLSGISLTFEGRYGHGLINIIKGPAGGESMRNRCLMAFVGIGF